MRAAVLIGLKDLRQRLRDRSAIVLAFVAPIALASIISLAFGTDDFEFRASWAVADQDTSPLSRTFTDDVLAPDAFGENVEVVRASSPDQARDLVESGDVSAAFVIPSGFEADVRAGRGAQIRVLKRSSSQIGADVAEAVARGFTQQVNASRLSVLTAFDAGAQFPDLEGLAADAARDRIPIQITDGSIGTREVTSANYFGPSMAIFFLFFTVGFAARSLFEEQRQGTMARLVAAPIGAAAIVAGKSLTALVLGLASLATMFVFMSVAFGVQWGDPVALAVLSVATVLSLLGLVALIQTVARTGDQGDSYASAAAITLALLGGNFFPIHQMPELLQTLSLLTPNGQALRGFTDLVYEDKGLAGVLPHIAALLGFAAVTGGLAVLRARSRLVRA